MGNKKKKLKEEQKKPIQQNPIVKKVLIFLFINFVNIFIVLSFLDNLGIIGRYIKNGFNNFLGAYYIYPIVILIFLNSVLIFKETSKKILLNSISSFFILIGYLGILYIMFGNSKGLLFSFLNNYLFSLIGYWGTVVVYIFLFLINLILVLGVYIIDITKFLYFRFRTRELKFPSGKVAIEGTPESFEDKPKDKIIIEEIKQLEDLKDLTPSQKTSFSKKSSTRKSKILEFLKEENWDKVLITEGEIKRNMEVIRRTLLNFGIQVTMGEVNIGPKVTQYTLKPREGIRLSNIVSLTNELALALSRHPIRIEAPIPGKPYVGIEVPNEKFLTVKLKNLLLAKNYKKYKNKKLAVAFGRDLSGKPVYVDIETMPHLLIAGSTGSGKSMCMHNILINLFYKNTPDSLKIILVDPKKVELSLYENIPYLLTDVVKDTAQVINILKWLINEMEKRYDFLLEQQQRDIMSYNIIARREKKEQLPYIILMIDEVADIMLKHGKEFESLVVRLAQLARAVGIHMVLSTQRPSTDVITGLIKANIPHRIAFKTSSAVDSRVILDKIGAEKLLGKGDMLYLDGNTSYIKRIQGVFLSTDEIKNIVKFLKTLSSDELLAKKFKKELLQIARDEDELFEEAKEIVLKEGFATTSLLQRKLRIGYMRAARLIDLLEEKGVIEQKKGQGPRKVILDKENEEKN